MAEEKWYFTKEQLSDSPSRRCGIDPQQESKYRQQAADLIQNMGQALMVSQLCINTAIVYMHRFYAFHSFTHFHRNHIAAASLFLAAKVEEQPRKLQSVIEAGHNCLYPKSGRIDVSSEHFLEQTQDLIFNENILLQTLGFDVAIDHPHTHVVKTCNLVRASKDLAQSSYFMASNTLHKTTMCLQYKPTVVACFCIHVACKWSNWQIPQSKEGKHWFEYVDTSVTTELLDRLTLEFLHYFDTKSSSQERDSRKALAAQEEAHHRQHTSSSRNMHSSGHPGHSSQSSSHASASQHRQHGQHKMPSVPHLAQTSSYSQQHPNHPNHHSSISQPHYNSQNPNMAQVPRDAHKKIDEKMKHQLDYNKMQNVNRPRLPPEAIPNKNTHNRHKPEMYPQHNAYTDRSKEVPENYQNRMISTDQRTSGAVPRIDPYKSDKDMKLKPNPQMSMDMKKREFNNMTSKSNMNEYAMQQSIPQKPPPNYHEYKNQNNLPAVNKHGLPNNNKLLMKPEMKPAINNLPILEETPKSEVIKTPPKPSIFSPDNKDTSFYKKSKTEARTPNSKKPTSPNGRKIETPKKAEIRPQERTPSQQIIKSENKVKSVNSAMRLTDTPVIPTVGNNPNIPRPISPFISPLKKSNSGSRNRTRTNSGLDPELVPLVKKLEDTSDYGDFFRSKLSPQNNELLHSTSNIAKSSLPEISSANGIETNPDLISSLLKESLLGLDNSNSNNANSLQLIQSIAPTSVPNVPSTLEPQSVINDDFKHKSEKKKKKDKHKHKDKTKEERKKHKKDKERSKDRQAIEMNPAQPVPIKITIPKDKIDMPVEPSIKIKIPKEKIKSLPRDSGNLDQRPIQGLKIKIPKEAVDNYTENSKKRERALSADRGPPAKSTRTT